MKLKDCTIGKLVFLQGTGIGHVVGLTYNTGVRYTGMMTVEELLERTIPLVKFPGEGFPRGVHQDNITEYKG